MRGKPAGRRTRDTGEEAIHEGKVWVGGWMGLSDLLGHVPIRTS